jgi:hypothetical protein
MSEGANPALHCNKEKRISVCHCESISIRSNLVRRIICSVFVFASLVFAQGCSSGTQSSTAIPTESQPGGRVYTLDPRPADFVEEIDNPYFPLIPGTKWEYEIRQGTTVVEKDTVEVLTEKRGVNGIQATVVRDTVTVDDQVVEDTYDWFAQDNEDNVWYVGETVDNYIAGVLVNHSGSWEWGVDGALPGIIMWADPAAHLNEQYYQEYYPGKAEDKGQVLSVDESVTVPFGSFENVVQTYDFSTLESRAKEHKFYAPRIGLIKEIDLNSGEEVVLVGFTSSTK